MPNKAAAEVSGVSVQKGGKESLRNKILAHPVVLKVQPRGHTHQNLQIYPFK